MYYSIRVFLVVYLWLNLLCINNICAQQSNKWEADFDYLIEELRLQHKGLYQYKTKQVVDSQLDSLRKLLKKPMNKIEFFKIVYATIALTNEGHTYAYLPKWAMVKVGLSKSFLPLAVKFCNKKLLIHQYYGKEHPKLKRGLQILSINGKTVEQITKDLFSYMPSDGFNETFKYESLGLGVNLSLLYRLIYGKAKRFELVVQEFEKDAPLSLTLKGVRFTKFRKQKNIQLKSKKFNFQQFQYTLLNDSIGYLSVPSFGNIDSDKGSFSQFYAESFRKIDSAKVKHLILDLQANRGGTEGNENLLYSYLSKDVFQKYAFVSMPLKPYKQRKTRKSYIEDGWQIKNERAERGEHTLRSDYYSDLGYRPVDKKMIYDNKLYILTSGTTFSGGAEFSSMVKMNQRGVFIGEETGGVYEGNISGHAATIQLPNSKITVDIPIMHFRINVEPEKKGRGVMPEHTVPQTWEAYLQGKNAKLDYVLERLVR